MPFLVRDSSTLAIYTVDSVGKRHLALAEYNALKVALGAEPSVADMASAALAAIPNSPPAAGGATDLTPVLAAIAAVKAELDAIKATSAAPEPKTLTIAGPITGTLS